MPPKQKRKRSKTLTGIQDLKPAPYNPRRISDEAFQGLTTSLSEFGDISGIVWNAHTGHVIAGHQRLKALKKQYGCKLKCDPDTETIVCPDGRRFPIRIVDWPLPKEKAANIAANSPLLAGEFIPGIEDIIKDLVGDMPDLSANLRLDELNIFDNVIPGDNEDIDEVAMNNTQNECPKCGFKW